MITSASIEASGVSPQPLPPSTVARGDASYPLDWWDLIAFYRCQRRWRHATAHELNPRVSFGEMVRVLATGSPDLINTYAHRPADFVHTRLECPSCKSVSPAKVCRTCALARVSISEVREWNGSSRFCHAWYDEQAKHNRRIVTDDVWTRGNAAFTSLTADPAIMELAFGSTPQQLVTAMWHDSATGLDIPLRTVIASVPSQFRGYSHCLATLETTSDAAPHAWNRITMERGHHIAAAFRHMLHAAATGETRTTHCWIIVEKNAPHLVSRRSTTPELLAAGTTLVQDILAEYAQCLATGIWSTFDSASTEPPAAYTPVSYESWMANTPTTVRPLGLPFTPEIVEA